MLHVIWICLVPGFYFILSGTAGFKWQRCLRSSHLFCQFDRRVK